MEIQTAAQIIEAGQKTQWKGSTGSDNNPTDQQTVEMEYLFALLTLEYPFFLPKADGDLKRKMNMWISLLRSYDRPARMRALQKCLSHYTAKGGPSIGEFLGLLKVDPAHRQYKALPMPEANPEIAEAELDKLRKLLNPRKRQSDSNK